MKKSLLNGLSFCAIISTTSCATIFTGTKDTITFNSKPEGAKVLHKGVEKCVTPCTVEIPRALSKQIATFKKDGYADKEVKLEKTFNPVTLLNLLFGGVIGAGIDTATGSVTKYSPKTYTVELDTK